jgi:hypothetical protein
MVGVVETVVLGEFVGEVTAVGFVEHLANLGGEATGALDALDAGPQAAGDVATVLVGLADRGAAIAARK